ncbi:MAG TPA: xanthine dehydrogenase family protein subunit M [Candidatus Sulfotelmatobacter sp.]|nr:xanthine dehydrogenase family protein subunit M [Candidatus Sulfotelmatobacter sp.]
MNRFEWVNANSVDQALAAVTDESSFKAGGVDLLDLMKDGIASPSRLVNIRQISGLDQISEDDKGLRIGPLVTLTQIEEHPAIQKKYPALSEAASRIATPQIRNMATIGGNLVQRPRCWYFRSEDFHCRKKGGTHCFAQDGENDYHAIFDNRVCAIIHPSGIAVPLVAMNGRVEITTKKGKREVALEEFFISPTHDVRRENVLEPGELITAILVPSSDARTAYYKQGEKESFDWPIADVAVALTMQGSRCSKASIVLGGAAPYPYRAKAAEAKLNNSEITEDSARAAAEAAMANATPLEKNAYKIPIFEAIVRRTILRAAGMKAEGVAA